MLGKIARAMSMSRPRGYALIVPLVTAGVIVCCVSSSSGATSHSSAKAKSGDYSLGEIDDLTQGFSSVDVYWHDGIVAAVHAANAHGGVNGHKVTLYSRDSQGSGQVGVAAFKTLTSEDHVSAILGAGDSLVAAAIYPLATAQHIPITAAGPASSELVPGSIMFNFDALTEADAKTQVAFAKQLFREHKIKSKRVVSVAFDTPDGTSYATDVKKAAKKAGLDYAGSISVAPAATDYGSAAAKFVSLKAAALLTQVSGVSVPQMMGALKTAGVPQTTPIIGFSWSTATSMPWANAYGVTAYRSSGNSPAVKAYDSAVSGAGYNPAHPYIVEGYADGELVLGALKACGYPCSPSQLLNKIETLHSDINGLAFGPVVWSKNAHVGPTVLSVARFTHKGQATDYAKPVTVYTPSGKPTS